MPKTKTLVRKTLVGDSAAFGDLVERYNCGEGAAESLLALRCCPADFPFVPKPPDLPEKPVAVARC